MGSDHNCRPSEKVLSLIISACMRSSRVQIEYADDRGRPRPCSTADDGARVRIRRDRSRSNAADEAILILTRPITIFEWRLPTCLRL